MKADFGRYIDHTLLRPIGTTNDIRRLCTEAIEYGMAAVCIFPSYIPMARDLLKESRVKIATVIAFPFGVTFTEIKEAEMRSHAEALQLLQAGASRLGTSSGIKIIEEAPRQ